MQIAYKLPQYLSAAPSDVNSSTKRRSGFGNHKIHTTTTLSAPLSVIYPPICSISLLIGMKNGPIIYHLNSYPKRSNNAICSGKFESKSWNGLWAHIFREAIIKNEDGKHNSCNTYRSETLMLNYLSTAKCLYSPNWINLGQLLLVHTMESKSIGANSVWLSRVYEKCAFFNPYRVRISASNLTQYIIICRYLTSETFDKWLLKTMVISKRPHARWPRDESRIHRIGNDIENLIDDSPDAATKSECTREPWRSYCRSYIFSTASCDEKRINKKAFGFSERRVADRGRPTYWLVEHNSSYYEQVRSGLLAIATNGFTSFKYFWGTTCIFVYIMKLFSRKERVIRGFAFQSSN